MAAARLAEEGERGDAERHLDHALSFFTAVGATRHAELAEARAPASR
jgi:hypothetical protein